MHHTFLIFNLRPDEWSGKVGVSVGGEGGGDEGAAVQKKKKKAEMCQRPPGR